MILHLLLHDTTFSSPPHTTFFSFQYTDLVCVQLWSNFFVVATVGDSQALTCSFAVVFDSFIILIVSKFSIADYPILPTHTCLKRRNLAALFGVQDTRTFCCTVQIKCTFTKGKKNIIHLQRRWLNCLGRGKCWWCMGSRRSRRPNKLDISNQSGRTSVV